MHQKVPPPLTESWPGAGEARDTKARGLAMLQSPLLNKGAAFSREERTALGLTGLLPAEIRTLHAQVRQAYSHYESLPDVPRKYGYLIALQDRNQILFYRLFADHPTDDWRAVAVAVAEAATTEGLARVKLDDMVEEVREAMWKPEYRRIQAC